MNYIKRGELISLRLQLVTVECRIKDHLRDFQLNFQAIV